MIVRNGVLVVAAALLAGCAGVSRLRVDGAGGDGFEPPPTPPVETSNAFRGVPDKYRGLADSAERAGDLRRALLYRKVVLGFSPGDPDVREHVERLEGKIRVQVDRHYRAGLGFEERGETAKALREFLSVLLLDPDHREAFRRVKAGTYGKNGKKVVDAASSKSSGKADGYPASDKEANHLRNAAERKQVAERRLREADAHHAAGVRRFLADDPEGAIREWEKALSLDPLHTKARRDLEKAKRLKGKIETPK